MLEFYKQTSKESTTIEKLKNLVIDYSKSNTFLQKQKARYSEVLNKEKKDGKEIFNRSKTKASERTRSYFT